MVATINPASVPASVAGLAQSGALAPREQRDIGRQDSASPLPQYDSVSVGEAALSWRAARESVRQGLSDLDLSVSVARDAAKLVAEIGEAAHAGDDVAVQAALSELDGMVKAGIAAGGAALTGASVRVQTERDVVPFEIEGLDLRVKESADDAMRLTRSTNAGDAEAGAAAVRDAEESLVRIQAGLDRLRAAAQRLEVHDGFLATAEGAVSGGLRSDLTAESARLLALQVRQGLSESSASIASARPDSVLGLFRG